MNYNKILSSLFCLLLTMSLPSCTDWLDVQEKTSVEEKDLFTTYMGFQDALAECYATLAGPSLYGQNLTMDMVDLLGNLYEQPNDQRMPMFYYLYLHDYTQSRVKDNIDNVFQLFYQVIAKSNIILKHAAKEGQSVLTPEERQMVSGEAHAMLALCHFEILRLFGPVPTEGTASDIRLPFSQVTDITTRPENCDYSTFVNRIRDEFHQARTLLAGIDPVFDYTYDELNKLGMEGYEHVVVKDPQYMISRQFRLNYWAICALQARFELYVGNKSEAYKIAHEVLDARTASGERIVELSTLADVSEKCYSNPSESLFLLSVPDVLKYASVFGVTASTVDADMVHTIPEADLKNKIFEDRYLDEDKRYTDGWKIDAVKTGGGGTVPILFKYFHEEENNAVLTLKMQTKNQVVPVIRLSEIYLILMETSDNLSEINRLYKEFMLARNVNLQTDAFTMLAEVDRGVMYEYLREFYGEGQMFFYYKRKAMESDFPYGMKDFRKESYVLPFSDSVKQKDGE